ncbi:MAG TPA: hypothetical protein VGR21_04975, partial [Cryptosporangiaceae bacterium]|nr:hypothetical protein [Cryptosporangiaceae bacterium]
YVFAFEATSALLITAAVGAMLLTQAQKPKGAHTTQRERSRARFRAGNYPAPKPGPGVYALADSVATPALLPDGSVAEGSVPPAAGDRRDVTELTERALPPPKGGTE